MTIQDAEENIEHYLGRLLKSKDHEYPIFFNGEYFTDFSNTLKLNDFRSDGDYFCAPTFTIIKDV